MTMITIRKELHRDVEARETLLDRAFGDARFSKSSERLREDRLPRRRPLVRRGRATAAWSAPRGCGTSRAGPGAPALLLGPLAVDPDCRSRGIGAALMQRVAGAKPRGSATAPCCWSATRPTTAASASRPRRPAACGCRARYERNRLLGASSSSPARSTARAARSARRPAGAEARAAGRAGPRRRRRQPRHALTPRRNRGRRARSARRPVRLPLLTDMTRTAWSNDNDQLARARAASTARS